MNYGLAAPQEKASKDSRVYIRWRWALGDDKEIRNRDRDAIDVESLMEAVRSPRQNDVLPMDEIGI